MKVIINKPLKNYAIGQIVEINPSEQYWAKRLEDAKIDNCIEVVKSSFSRDSKKFKSEVKKYGKSAS